MLGRTMIIITGGSQGDETFTISDKEPNKSLKCFRKELLTISAAVMGIEFAYAAETAFVSPTLLKIGENLEKVTSKHKAFLNFYFLSRRVPVPHDSHLVPLTPGGLLSNTHPRKFIRQVLVHCTLCGSELKRRQCLSFQAEVSPSLPFFLRITYEHSLFFAHSQPQHSIRTL